MHGYNATHYPVKMTGYRLARNGRSASQRAALAASIISGEIEFTSPTKKQIAELLGVSVSYVDRALELDPIRRRWMALGLLKLTAFPKAPTDAALTRDIKSVGIDHAFDLLVADL